MARVLDGWDLASCCPGGPGSCRASSGRLLRCHAAGGLVETYPGNEAAEQRLDQAVTALAACAPFKSMLSQIRVVLSPPGQGLEDLPEFGAIYEGVEGTALPQGFGDSRGMSNRPTMVVTASSVLHWNLGVVHELLHLFHFLRLSHEAQRLIDKTYATTTPNPERCKGLGTGCNQRELFAYLGQWYLAGYGEYIRDNSIDPITRHSAIFEMLSTILGSCRVPVGDPEITDATAKEWVDWQLGFYQMRGADRRATQRAEAESQYWAAAKLMASGSGADQTRAVRILRALINQPGPPWLARWCRLRLASIWADRGELDKARTYFDQTAPADADEEYRSWRQDVAAKVSRQHEQKYWAAAKLMEQGTSASRAQAIQTFEALLKVPDPPWLARWSRLRLAVLWCDRGEPSKARMYFTKALPSGAEPEYREWHRALQPRLARNCAPTPGQ